MLLPILVLLPINFIAHTTGYFSYWDKISSYEDAALCDKKTLTTS
jgi:hypothetical protein